MTKKEVELFFKGYAAKYNLDYDLVFSNTKRTLGSCDVAKKVIKISRYHIQGSEDYSVKDTILHELAHAIAFERHGRKALNHGHYWQTACKEIGAEPNRLKDNAYTIQRPKSKYDLTCPKCGEVYHMHRKSKHGVYSCSKCNVELDVKQNW